MKSHSSFLRILNAFFPIYLALVIVIVGIPVATYHFFAQDLGTKDRIMDRNNTGLILLDRGGTPFFRFYDAKSIEDTPIDKIPKHVQNAVIAIEDKNFYTHEGFSWWGIGRSILLNLQHKDIVSGGSTITQQLVKNSLLNSQKSFLRKYQELVLAQEIERRYTKKEILEMYLNSIYFGEGAFGIEQAAKIYFNKDVSELTVAEGALLAGILPAPSRYSPISGDAREGRTRQLLVLSKMKEYGYITDSEYSKAVHEKLQYANGAKDLNSVAPHFALWIKKQLIDSYGEERIIRSGFQVKTTLNKKWQEYAEEVVKGQVTLMKGLQVTNGATVVIDPVSRQILVMVGSVDWNEPKFGKFNVAITPRQPGSSFKPIVYGAAFEQGIITPATILKDSPTVFEGGYKPVDYDRKFRGNVTVRRALSNSLNVPAVSVIEQLGVPSVLDTASHFGIDTLKDPSNYGPSLALGTGEVPLIEMTNAYATYADKGVYKDPISILSIKDKFGKTIYTPSQKQRTAVSPQTAFMISSVLSDNVTRSEAFGSVLNLPGRVAAVKTGTTDDYKDAWTLGYTPYLTVGVWIGNNDNTPMDRVPGSIGAAPIWKSLMEYYHKDVPNMTFTPPEGIISVRLCRNGYLLPPGAPDTVGYTEYFIEGSQPTTYCSITPTPTPGGDSPTPSDSTNPT